MALAKDNLDEGYTSLMEFIANTPEKIYKELITKTWKAETGRKKLDRLTISRIKVISDTLNGHCVVECGQEKVWLSLAKEVLENNGISVYEFADAVRNLLIKGRGKKRNLLITGPRDCGKTFLLNPLNKIFNTFANPSSASYAFVGIHDKEVAFLNDLRWNPTMLPWQDFLNLLEGQSVHLPTPKTHYSEDICVSADIPIFATSINAITFIGQSNNIAGENDMMETRWKRFSLSRSISKDSQKDMPACPRCFAELISLSMDYLWPKKGR